MKFSYNLISFLTIMIFTLNSSFSQTTSVKFEVKVPSEGLKENASVFLAGSFNCWNPHDSSYIMKKTSDNLYSLAVPVFEDKKYEYKYTQGDWGSVETTNDGSEIKNREIVCHKDLVVNDTVLKWKLPVITQKKDTTLKLTAEQIKTLSKLKEEMGKDLDSKMKIFAGTLKNAMVNMLSEKPNVKLRKKYHKQMAADVNRAVDMAANALWKFSSILTPEQKKAMLTELNNPNGPADIFGMVTKMMSQPQK